MILRSSTYTMPNTIVVVGAIYEKPTMVPSAAETVEEIQFMTLKVLCRDHRDEVPLFFRAQVLNKRSLAFVKKLDKGAQVYVTGSLVISAFKDHNGDAKYGALIRDATVKSLNLREEVARDVSETVLEDEADSYVPSFRQTEVAKPVQEDEGEADVETKPAKRGRR